MSIVTGVVVAAALRGSRSPPESTLERDWWCFYPVFT